MTQISNFLNAIDFCSFKTSYPLSHIISILLQNGEVNILNKWNTIFVVKKLKDFKKN